MKECWRWFGPVDRISLEEVRQTGARGVVTALHDVPYGEVWTPDAIMERKALITRDPALGLEWTAVESLPVHEDIKRGEGRLDRLFDAYRQSLANLAASGVRTVCYNFMPLLDWTRTELSWPLPGGATALRFDVVEFAVFDCFMLARPDAEADFDTRIVEAAADLFRSMSEGDKKRLLANIMAGLPGAFERFDIAGLRAQIDGYRDVDAAALRSNFKRFLDEVMPAAEELGIEMCVHPDDPPRPILGLPRIVSTRDDIRWVLEAHDSPANGLTLCAGSLGSRHGNDVVEIAEAFAHRIYYAHLRGVTKETDGSFFESDHLGGDTDMVALVGRLLAEEERRRQAGHACWEIPFRPDHGHVIGDDAARQAHPGYPMNGRMRGLAELRGVVAALSSRRAA